MNTKSIIKTYIPEKYKPDVQSNILLYKVPDDDIHEVCRTLYTTKGVYLRTIFATDDRQDHNAFTIHYVFGIPNENCFLIPYLHTGEANEFPSIAEIIYEATFYESEIYTFFGLKPVQHHNLQPVILHANWPKTQFPLRKDFKWNHRPENAVPGKGYDHVFEVIEGEGIYEIPVGPVHAGIIEPGHFRFSVAGEDIVNLEPMLGFVHKGTEKLFEVLPLEKKVKLSERVSGDSSFSHSLAFCQAVELLDEDLKVPVRAEYIRVVFAELERLANHLGDTGFIMSDTGFSFGGSQCTRLREIVMQLNSTVSGHRFLRGVNTFGGVKKDITPDQSKLIIDTLEALGKDFNEIIEICDESETVMNRLKGTGILDKKIASDHGVVGVAARASGLNIDIRIDHPYAAYRKLTLKKATHSECDVYARYRIRVQEVLSSIAIIRQALATMPAGEILAKKPVTLAKNALRLSMVEGWRGDIVYVVVTGNTGEITRVSVRDPSFLNWPAVPYAVLGNIVPDFPLINKSFNLSYSGFDR